MGRTQSIDTSASIRLLERPSLVGPRLGCANSCVIRMTARPEKGPRLPPFYVRTLPLRGRVAVVSAVCCHTASRPRKPRPARLSPIAVAAEEAAIMAAPLSKEARLAGGLFSFVAEANDAANDGPLPRLRRGPGKATGLLGQIPRPSTPITQQQLVTATTAASVQPVIRFCDTGPRPFGPVATTRLSSVLSRQARNTDLVDAPPR